MWTQSADTTDRVAAALGRVQLLRLPLVVGDSYELFDRTLPNVDDFDGDGRADSLRVVARVTVVGLETSVVGGFRLSNVARVRTELTQTYTLSSRAQPVMGRDPAHQLQ